MPSLGDAPRTVRAAIAILFAICSIVPDSAIAIPTNNLKGCVNDSELKKSPLEFYIIHDPENASTNPHTSINIREQPTIKSPVVHAVYSGNPVIIFQQVVKDNYCWLQVEVTTLSDKDSTSYLTVKGWVRGDLVTEDKSP
jgi:hypothetical protein